MNYFVLSLLVLAAAVNVDAGKAEQVKAVAEKCIAAEKLTPADVEAVQKYSMDLSKEAKCFIKCFMQEFGLMGADGKMQQDVFMTHARTDSKGDPEQMRMATEMYNTCAGKASGGDHCESAFGWASCMMKEMTARNIPLDSIFL